MPRSKSVSPEAVLSRLHEIVESEIEKVPVMTTDRNCGLREQAKLARELFRGLALKNISVKLATGAWCFWVVISIPVAEHASTLGQRNARELMKKILLKAFPNHDDRSHPQSDYFDDPWSIGTHTQSGDGHMV